MLKVVDVKIEDIYIPTARRQELDQSRVDEITERMLNEDQEKPIRVRKGKGRLVLIDGVNRLEASRALGEEVIKAFIVQAPKF